MKIGGQWQSLGGPFFWLAQYEGPNGGTFFLPKSCQITISLKSEKIILFFFLQNVAQSLFPLGNKNIGNKV